MRNARWVVTSHLDNARAYKVAGEQQASIFRTTRFIDGKIRGWKMYLRGQYIGTVTDAGDMEESLKLAKRHIEDAVWSAY